MPPSRIARFALLLILALISPLLVACAGQKQADLSMLPSDRLPAEVQSAPASVREAYRFAAANPDLMKQIPCYCGCGAVGHTSNYACYVSGQDAQGRRTFDEHALGCSICVDITQDVMRLTRQGKSPAEIKAYVDTNYSPYGASNMP